MAVIIGGPVAVKEAPWSRAIAQHTKSLQRKIMSSPCQKVIISYPFKLWKPIVFVRIVCQSVCLSV